MFGELQNQLQRLRQRVLKLCCLQGVLVALGTIVGTAFVVGLFDYWLHLDSSFLRLVLLAAIVGGAGYVVWRRVVRPLRLPLSDTYLAEQVERQFPQLNDRLVSVVQFLGHRASSNVGSPELQKNVVDQTMKDVGSIDFRDATETRSLKQAAVVVAALCLFVGWTVATNPSVSALAARRLTLPFSDSAWPRTTELQLIDAEGNALSIEPGQPLYVVTGSVFELFVRNKRGSIPNDLRVEMRKQESSSLTSQAMRKIERTNSADKLESWGITTLSANKPLEFRVIGGDDFDMPYYELVPVKAPDLVTLQVSLTAPVYTKLTSKQLPEGKADIESVLGTRVDITATVNKPLQSAVLKIDDLYTIPFDILEDGRKLQAAFEIDKPGQLSYWFVFTDENGFENRHPRRYQLTGIEDRVPHVVIENPAASVTATPQAEVPLQINTDDDFGIQSIWLKFQKAGQSPDSFEFRTLFTYGEQVSLNEKISESWHLSELQLNTGDQIMFQAESSDFLHSEANSHIGQSSPRTITIVSNDEKLTEIAGQQSDLLLDLQRLQDDERHLQHQVQELQLQMKNAGELRSVDRDLLNRVERDQQQLAERLADSEDSIDVRIQKTQSELSNNRLSAPKLQSQLQRLEQSIATLKKKQLAEIAQNLTAVRKQAELLKSEKESSNDKPNAKKQKEIDQQVAKLGQIERNQAQVVETLDRALDKMSQWIDQRELLQTLNEIADDQENLMEQTREIGRETLSKPLSQLTPQQQADLSRVGKRQEQLAEQIDQLKKLINPDESDNRASSMSAHLQKQAFDNRMQQAAQDIAQNNVGEALQKQDELVEDLKQFQETLQKQSTPDSQEMMQKLEQLEQAAAEHAQNQAETLEKLQSLPAEKALQKQEKLGPAFEELRKEAEQLEQELQRLQLQKMSETAERAKQNMQQGQQSLAQPDSSAEQSLKEAQAQIEQLRDELRQQRQQLQQQLAHESILKLADRLKTMVERHQNVTNETTRLEAERRSRGRWSRGQLISLKQLVAEQKTLTDTVREMVKGVQSVEVIAVALRQIVVGMEQEQQLLSKRQTGSETGELQSVTQTRLHNLLDAIESKPEPKADSNQGPMPDEQPGMNDNPPPSESFPAIAQLRVLRAMQQELLERTQKMNEQLPTAEEWTDEQTELVSRLALEQAGLAELTQRIFTPPAGKDQTEQQLEKEPLDEDQPAEADDKLRSLLDDIE